MLQSCGRKGASNTHGCFAMTPKPPKSHDYAPLLDFAQKLMDVGNRHYRRV